MEHVMRLHYLWLDKIKSNEKNLEIRMYDDKRKIVKVGHFIKFLSEDTGEYIIKQVDKIIICSTFEEALSNDQWINAGMYSFSYGLTIYNKLYKSRVDNGEQIILFYLK